MIVPIIILALAEDSVEDPLVIALAAVLEVAALYQRPYENLMKLIEFQLLRYYLMFST